MIPPSFVLACALPEVRRPLPGQGFVVPAALRSGSARVDASGISQVFRRSILCLCSVPGPRSSRRALACCGHVDAAPAIRTAKASALADFGANPQLRHPLPYASRVALPHTCKACFRLTGLSLPGGSRTRWIATRGFSSCCRSSSPPALLTLPDCAPLYPGYGIEASASRRSHVAACPQTRTQK